MPPSALPKLEPYFRHAQGILDGTDLGRWTDKTAIIAQGPTLTAPDISPDVQEAVCEALMTNRKVDVQYRSKHESESKMILLSPLGIVVRTGVVYLVAISWTYEDIRHYVLHRMSEPRLTDESVHTPPGFRLADPLGDGARHGAVEMVVVGIRELGGGAGAGGVAGGVSGGGSEVGRGLWIGFRRPTITELIGVP